MRQVRDLNPALVTTARREYVPVGSTPASLLAKAVATSTGFRPLNQ